MKLRAWLTSNNLTQQKFGEKIGRSQQAVAKYCAGRQPDKRVMTRILKVTGGQVTPNDWFDLPATAGGDPQGAAA